MCGLSFFPVQVFSFDGIQVPVADSICGEVHEVGGCNELLFGGKEMEHLFNLKKRKRNPTNTIKNMHFSPG